MFTKEQLKKLGIQVEEDKEYTDEEAFALIEKNANDMRGDLNKHKDLLSKRNSEIAEFKRKEQDKLSEEEKTRLHYEELEKENASYKKTIAKSQKVNEYMGIGYPKELAEKIADAELEGKSAVELHKQFMTSREESLKAELLKNSPDPSNNKQTQTVTKEDVIKGGYEAMMKLKEENPTQYQEFFGKN